MAKSSGPRGGAGGRKSGKSAGRSGQSGRRDLTVRVKTARGRKLSSTRWLQRQLNDPYVQAAKDAGYRSRAAFKLVELDDRFGILKKGAKVLDLGAAPGGWTQVAVARAGAGNVVAVDLQPMEAVPGAVCLELDFLDPEAPEKIRQALGQTEEGGGVSEGGLVDCILSDMAAPATGHRPTDHLKIMALCEAALDFAFDVLAPGGSFVCKVLQGGTEGSLLTAMKQRFKAVHHAKPPASRADSAEMYVLATGFRGAD